ncbi:MAG TPA: glycosyltransferase [Vicinamibacterales bacterium]|nr:glycosyltransferase [Vicinamibacterales bacterium]
MTGGPVALHLSVVIPTHNGSHRITPLLRALASQSFEAARMDVVIVDNGSTDGSAERVAADPAFRLLSATRAARIVALDRPGLTHARVEGVRASSGDIVLFLDDDTEPERECCAEALAPFEDARVGVVFGRVFPKYTTPPHPSIRKREGILAINHGLGSTPIVWKEPRDFAPTLGVGLAVRRTAFVDAYPWREPHRVLPDRVGTRMISGGDLEIGQFLARAGWWRTYNPRMVIHHLIDPARLRVRSFMRLIVGIERSRATFEDKFSLGPSASVRRLKAARDALAIAAAAPWWMLTRDGPRGWCFALASRAGRLAGAYSGRRLARDAAAPR